MNNINNIDNDWFRETNLSWLQAQSKTVVFKFVEVPRYISVGKNMQNTITYFRQKYDFYLKI